MLDILVTCLRRPRAENNEGTRDNQCATNFHRLNHSSVSCRPWAFATASRKGTIIHSSQPTSDTVITVAINGTNITGGTITMPAGAAGTGYTTDFSTIADRSNEVNEGDKIRFTSNGGAN